MGKLNTVQNGKGDKSRVSNLAKFEAGYDHIDWGHNRPRVVSAQEIDGVLYTKMSDGSICVDRPFSIEPLTFVNFTVDGGGKLIPAPWSVCNLPPEEFNKPYTITTSNHVQSSE